MEKKTLEGLTEEQISFQLILHSGNARSKLLQSLKQFREGHEIVASDLLKEAEDDLRNAHDIHFQMVQQEASGETISFSLLLMHAEDHFMSTMTIKELVGELLPILQSLKQ
ncbi:MULTISPECIES: PTS lactose/cellobiose transporter subunit IIA [Bacillus]|uniref:PTS system cellobiose-specific IIA component n=1 Tax=Bacillus aerius TaxID=293388 RepID=A0ABR6B434_9BACI|nr:MULTISPECIES: PTS lactose/cellobiose transporter subunit IIA [Bacillus]EMI12181.1 phosphotransferase system pts lactose cellobiose-specific iia subunit [Bacillus stratosphericus LAMA 585]MBW3700347.1 PTS lactose/cellobiose transporter subunit IIA [Bacillus aerophilus]MBA8918897.1 PTS system cellobiose-specific IIA component [Bacillus aerius]MBY0188178.1 PTS lactose/cellobiose transporter subunit IIA [Bacillus aerophilus]MCA0162541.1 PTS lactose/cellobiose transporter subunit IIA [Bacillus s